MNVIRKDNMMYQYGKSTYHDRGAKTQLQKIIDSALLKISPELPANEVKRLNDARDRLGRQCLAQGTGGLVQR